MLSLHNKCTKILKQAITTMTVPKRNGYFMVKPFSGGLLCKEKEGLSCLPLFVKQASKLYTGPGESL